MKSQELLLQKLLEEQFERATKGLLAFTTYTKKDYHIGWHHEALCRKLNAFVRGEILRLMVFMPPRHGKSELVSRRLPAYMLGKNPDLQIIGASYSDSLASTINRDVQRIIESTEYKLLFPNTRLSGSSTITGAMRNSDVFEIVGRKGKYKSAGIGTGITGLGADVAIIDDPIKDRTEADSQTYRDRCWEWYTSTLYTRLEKNGRVLLTLTRWHEDDLAGRLLNEAKTNSEADQWEIINYPAIKENYDDPTDPREIGQPLWPEKYDIDKLSLMKSSVGTRVWSALYQQNPTPASGGLFNVSMFEYVDLPDQFDYTVMMADTAYKDKQHNDFTVCTLFGAKGNIPYVIDVWRDRIKSSDVEIPIINFIKKHTKYGFRGAYIEPKGHGIYLNQILPRKGILIPSEGQLNEFFSDRHLNKVERANNIIPYLTNQKLHINKNIANKEELVSECLRFPRAPHDDFCDTVIDGVKYIYTRKVGILDVL